MSQENKFCVATARENAVSQNVIENLNRLNTGGDNHTSERQVRFFAVDGIRRFSQMRSHEIMLWTIVVILLILWLLGFSFHVAGGFVHLLLVIALAVVVIRLLTGRAP